jgi:hypothetical protein
MKTPLTFVAGLALILVLTAFPAFAQAPVNSSANSIDAELAAIEQRLGLLEKSGDSDSGPAGCGRSPEALDQQIRIVGRQRNWIRMPQPQEAASAATVDASRDGFDSFLRQFFNFGWAAATSGGWPILLARTRSIPAFHSVNPPDHSGHGIQNIDFRIMTDFGSGNVIVQEAYAPLRYWKKASFRFGKFKSHLALNVCSPLLILLSWTAASPPPWHPTAMKACSSMEILAAAHSATRLPSRMGSSMAG